MKDRKLPRLKNYNYSTNGIYFITVCTKDMKCCLSSICVDEPDNNVGDGAPDVPQTKLSNYGRVIENEILKMNKIYNNLYVEHFVIMPNHVHLLLVVSSTHTGGTSRAPSPTNSVVARYVSTLKRMTNKKCGFNLWQRSYYDHIIRNEEDYLYHIQYIEENPKKWLIGKDEYYI